MKTRKVVSLGLLSVLALASCGETPTAPPVVVASPSPSPTPIPEDDLLSCVQRNLKLEVQNGAGNPDIIFDYREILTAVAAPTNRRGAILRTECSYSRVVGWNASGDASCEQLGDRTGFNTAYRCIEPGRWSITATHGDFKAVWDGRLIRNRTGVGIEIDPASVSLRTYYRGVEIGR